MSLDIPTLFVITVFVCAVAGLLLLLSWLQNRDVRALAWWASSLIIGSIGVALIAARGDISDTWSIAIANAILATAYGMMWAGVRQRTELVRANGRQHRDDRPFRIRACQFLGRSPAHEAETV
jgi:hypothetical protein